MKIGFMDLAVYAVVSLATGDACCDYLYTRPGSEIEKKWQTEHPEGTFISK
ncbi:MAG: hypothetical protein IKZ51_08925 [Bacteroidales bacterium]|nr:hypothetical protein [Bacteroidales bacterium]